MAWTTASPQPFGPNRAPLLVGLDVLTGLVPTPVAVNQATGALLVSVSGGSGGGGTQYASGTSTPSPVTGNAIIFDASGTLENVSTSNPLPITGTISVGSTTDDTAFTAGTSTTSPAAGVYNDSLTALSSGYQGTLRSTAYRGLHTNLRNNSGTEIGTSTTPLQVSLANTASNSIQVNVNANQASAANLNATVIGVGTAGSPSGGVLSVQGVSGGQALPVSGTFYQATQPVSLTTLPSLVAGSANIGSVEITDGTNTGNVVAGDSGFNGVATASATKTYSFTTSTTGAQTILANTPAEGFSYIEVVLTSAGSGLAWTAQWSPTNGGTYLSINSWGSAPIAPMTSAIGVATGNVYRSAIQGNYFQLAISAMTGGTTTGYVTLRTTAPPTGTQNVNGTLTATSSGAVQSTTGTITTSSSSVTTAALNGTGAFAEVSIHGTYTGISFGITASDDSGTTFYNTPIWDTNNMHWVAPGSTITPGSNVSNVYLVPIHANVNEVKVLASAWSTGTANIKIGLSSMQVDPGSRMSQIMDAAGNARGANVDANGNLNIVPFSPSGQWQNGTASATGTSSTSLITAVTSNKIYLTSVQVMNTGATTAYVALQDGSGGTTKTVVQAPAGGGANVTFPTPIANTSGNAWYFAAGSSSTTIYVSAQGYASTN